MSEAYSCSWVKVLVFMWDIKALHNQDHEKFKDLINTAQLRQYIIEGQCMQPTIKRKDMDGQH